MVSLGIWGIHPALRLFLFAFFNLTNMDKILRLGTDCPVLNFFCHAMTESFFWDMQMM